jgi:ABC-type uncharacterized transport system auxiliary subunit
MNAARALLFAAALSALGGCVRLLPDAPPPPRLYPLEAGQLPRADGPHIAAVAAVAEPEGPQALMGDAIVWRRDGVIAFMSGGAWPGRTSDLLQAMVAETITRQGRLDAGVRRGAGVRADIEVRWDIIAFEVREEAGVLEARFAASVRIVSARTRALLAAEIVEIAEPLADRSGGAAANALARAARRGCARVAEMAADAALELQAQNQPSAASTSR